MNIGTMSCLTMAGILLIFAILFALLKEKAAILISGFNSFPKEKREKYDKLRMSRDLRNLWFFWCGLFAVGAILSHLISPYIAIITFIVWFILFFKEVHFDTEKAFDKYRL